MTKDIPVQQFVIDTLINENADIICLVEYVTDKGIEENLKNDYWFEESDTISGNRVLIAVKKALAPDGIQVINRDEVRDCYNFLHIEILMNNKQLSVIGVRMLSPMVAEEQTPPLMKYLSELETPFLCTGDFNSQQYRMSKWFHGISMENIVNTNLPLSKSSIIYTDKKNHHITGYGAVDHVLHSDDISVSSQYAWDFLSAYSGYPNIDRIAIGALWKIDPAYPDHALMVSDFYFTKQT